MKVCPDCNRKKSESDWRKRKNNRGYYVCWCGVKLHWDDLRKG